MKRYKITSDKCCSKEYEFNDIDEAIAHIINYALVFVDFNLFGSKEVYVDELIDDDYYFAAIVDPINKDVTYQSIWQNLRKD